MRPYVIINAAMTVDGKIDTSRRQGAAISSEEDKRRALELRAGVDAVMVGGNTLNNENPKLTVKLPELAKQRRSAGLPENPAKVGFTTRLTLDPDGDFMTTGPARRILFTTPATPPQTVDVFRQAGAEIFVHHPPRVDLGQALGTLYELGIRKAMLEGGATIISEFTRLGLADELQVYVAPRLFGGETAPTLVGGDGWPASGAIPLKLEAVQVLDPAGGLLIRYRFSK